MWFRSHGDGKLLFSDWSFLFITSLVQQIYKLYEEVIIDKIKQAWTAT